MPQVKKERWYKGTIRCSICHHFFLPQRALGLPPPFVCYRCRNSNQQGRLEMSKAKEMDYLCQLCAKLFPMDNESYACEGNPTQSCVWMMERLVAGRKSNQQGG